MPTINPHLQIARVRLLDALADLRRWQSTDRACPSLDYTQAPTGEIASRRVAHLRQSIADLTRGYDDPDLRFVERCPENGEAFRFAVAYRPKPGGADNLVYKATEEEALCIIAAIRQDGGFPLPVGYLDDERPGDF